MFKILSILSIFSLSLFASGGTGETDIIERTFNFVIFAGIVYYLVADPLKEFLTGRTLSFEKEFKKNETKLEESKLAKEKAEDLLVKAKRDAGLLIADAKKEAQLVSKKLEEICNNDIAILEKQQIELQSLDENKMAKSVVNEVIQDIINKSDIGLDQDSLTKSLLKKVS